VLFPKITDSDYAYVKRTLATQAAWKVASCFEGADERGAEARVWALDVPGEHLLALDMNTPLWAVVKRDRIRLDKSSDECPVTTDQSQPRWALTVHLEGTGEQEQAFEEAKKSSEPSIQTCACCNLAQPYTNTLCSDCGHDLCDPEGCECEACKIEKAEGVATGQTPPVESESTCPKCGSDSSTVSTTGYTRTCNDCQCAWAIKFEPTLPSPEQRVCPECLAQPTLEGHKTCGRYACDHAHLEHEGARALRKASAKGVVMVPNELRASDDPNPAVCPKCKETDTRQLDPSDPFVQRCNKCEIDYDTINARGAQGCSGT
jgi:hypothetical protein